MIGGFFLLISTAFGTYFATRKPEGLPPLEIKTISGGGKEQVLATLAMHPERQVLDSAAFSDLPGEYVLVNDTLGIAVRKPTEYRWTAGRLPSPGGVDWYDIPALAALSEEMGKMWGIDSTLTFAFYGVSLDQPFHLRVTGASLVNGVPLGGNPFTRPEVAQAFEKYQFADDPDANWFERQKFREETNHTMDSLNAARLPKTTDLYSGVFITAISDHTLPKYAGFVWHYLDLFEKVALALNQRLPPNNLLYVDRERHVIVFNESVHLRSVQVDSVSRDLIVNRVGYAILVDKTVYLVQLQFLSGQEERTLDDLQEYFRSVRLRGPSKGRR